MSKQWQGYFGIENLNLNPSQRRELIAALRALGPATDRQPARLNHWRTRLDGEAAIFEALFNQQVLTIPIWKNRLAGIFGVDPATIGHTVITHLFATVDTPIITFSRGGTDYLRVALFAGTSGTWQESGRECRAYLQANPSEWEGLVP